MASQVNTIYFPATEYQWQKNSERNLISKIKNIPSAKKVSKARLKMQNNKPVLPVLKWAGGKRQLMTSIVSLLPENISSCKYIEPFIGGGAVLFHLQPKKAIINDFNAELINVYSVIKNNLPGLIKDLKKHKNNADYFYKIRGMDRKSNFSDLPDIEKASRIIYLNKTCFNGLYRVNSAGEFNAPFGRYKNPTIVNEAALRAVNEYLNNNNVLLLQKDFEDVLKKADKNCFVYLDPPYHPISAGSNFTGYIQGGWDTDDQVRLKKACDELNKKGARFLLSNSSTDFIKDLYKDYSITVVKANRAINSDGGKRGRVDEVLVKNY